MRSPRKIALALAALVVVLIVVLVTVPWLFRDRIAVRLRQEIARSVNAKVDWHDVGLGVLRDFPNVTLSVNGLSVVGVAPFATDTLAAVRQARLVLDVGSVIGHVRRGDRIVVREIALDRPSLRLRVLPDGRTNWDISKQKPAAGAGRSGAVGVTLRDVRITDGRLTMDDEQTHLAASLAGIQERLRGDLGKERVTLVTSTRIDTASVRFAGIPYLSRVAIGLDADIDADLKAQRFTLANDTLRLNKLLLAFAGTVVASKPDMALDLSFSTPGTAFSEILSLVPAVYAHGFERIQTSGTMAASGRVRGTYGPKAFPALALRAVVKNGTFRDPSLPLPARDIFLDLAIDNPGGHVDNTVVSLNRFHALIGSRPLDAKLVVRTPVSDPDVDARVLGSVDLADVGRTVRLEGVSQLAGIVAADIAMRARVSDVDAKRYDRVSASGTMNVGRLALKSATPPHAVTIDTAALHFTPRAAELTSFAARVGASDARATGSLDNLLGFLLHDEELRGTASVSSRFVDLNEWRSDKKTTAVIPVPPRVDFALKAAAAKVSYGAITAANVRGGLRVKDQRITLEDLNMETMRGTVVANGWYETKVPDRPLFDIDFRLASVDIPSAFAALTTVQKLAPIARWAQGGVSGTVKVNGALGQDMTPVFSALTGAGNIETERLVMQGAPILEKLASAVKIDQIRQPALNAVRAAFSIADGRLAVRPFVVKLNGLDMTVAGSNGIDQTLKYDLGLAVPRALLGGAAGQLVSGLAARAGSTGADTAQAVRLGALVTGTVTDPKIGVSFAGTAGSVREVAQQLVQQQVADVKQRVDSTAESAKLRARAEAERLVAEAEKQATAIRTEARALADAARREGNLRADSLLARATNPVARIAAQAATDRLRREADQRAEQIIREADAKAEQVVAKARRQGAGH